MRFFLFLIFFYSAIYADIKEVVIFQTNDIHSYARKEWKDNQNGFFALSTLIKRERARYPKNNLLIDCGDLIQGSMIGSITKGQIGIEFLNEVKYDVWVPGNHEFDFGIEQLYQLIDASNSDILMSNLIAKNIPSKVKPWKMYEKDGVKIAVLGMTYPRLDFYLWGNKIKNIENSTILDMVDFYMPEILKEQPDIIILAMHHGLYGRNMQQENNIHYITKLHPEIDIILGGHIHNESEIKINNSWYSQSAHHAKSLLKLVVQVDNSKHKVLEITAEQLYLSSSEKEDISLLRRVDKFLKLHKSQKQRLLKQSTVNLSPFEITKMIAKAIKSASCADFVFLSTLPDFVKFSGNITEKELYLAAPFEDSIGVLELTKEEIIKVMNEHNKKFNLFYSNKNIVMFGKDALSKLPKKGKVKVAFSSYNLAGSGGKFKLLKKLAIQKTSNPLDTEILVRDAFRNELSEN